MSSVDSRIVTMKFDNAQFESGAQKTIGTLDKLKTSLHMTGANKGLQDVQTAANNVSFGHIQGGITQISTGFAAMATVAITALAGITQKAMAVGAQITKSLTIQPIKQGFDEYELKMGSIQTIMAGSGKSLEVVNKKLQELNEYSDKTIYSFKDMTASIGKFTNAGVPLDLAVASIKGISNAAALSGANSNEASRAMYNFSQALSSGVVRLQDWKSIELANMATKEFKQQLIDSAVAAGTLEKGADGMYKVVGKPDVALNATKNFNASLAEEWMTADVLTSTLERYSDETTDIGKRATAAAQDVKTFSMMMDTLKESVGSGWATTFEIIFGNFEEAKQLWTGVTKVIGGMLGDMADRRNKMLQDWKDLGGRDTLIDALRKALEGLKSIIKPITEAFREIFPATTGKDLYDLTVKFKEFAEKLKINDDTAQNLKNTFRGVFAVFSIVKQVVMGVIGVIFDLIGTLSKGSGGVLEITGNIGNFVAGIDSALKNGSLLTTFFDTLSKILQAPIKLLMAMSTVFVQLFSGFNSKAADTVNNAFGAMGGKLTPLKAVLTAVGNAIKWIGDKIAEAAPKMAPFIESVKNVFGDIGQAIADAFNGGGFDKILKLINTGLFAAILMTFRKFADGIKLDFGQGGFMDSVTDTFNKLTDTLGIMQANLKADILMKIAGAIALLVVSIVALSLIDSKKLTVAMTAIAAAFAELLGAMTLMTRITGLAGFAKIPVLAGGMILMAAAMVLMAMAIKKLAELSWNEVIKGLTGVGGALAMLIVSMKPLTSMSGGLVTTGIGIIALALGLNAMASAISKFAGMQIGEIGKGLVVIVGALVSLAFAMTKMPPNLLPTALGLLAISVSLNLIANAVVKMGSIPFGDMVKGLVGTAAALGSVVMIMKAMPENMALTAAGLLLVSFALTKITDAVVKMGGLSLGEVVTGLIGLGGALGILAVAMHFMAGAMPGALALGVMAISVSLLVPALVALGNVSIAQLATALGALVAVFIVMGGAAAILAPLSPVILALAGSLALIGLGLALVGAAFALVGAGMLMFATGLSILVGLGAAAAITIGTVLNAIIQGIPKLMAAFALGVVEFTKTIVQNIPVFVDAMSRAINGIMRAIRENAPTIIQTLKDFLGRMLDAVVESSPKINQAGFKLLIGFLQSVGENIHKVVTLGGRIITEFLRGIGDNSERIADRGAKTIIQFINALASAINNNSEKMNKAASGLASALIRGMVGGIFSGTQGVIDAITRMGNAVISKIKSLFGISSPSKEFTKIGRYLDEGLANGIKQYSHVADNSVDTMGNSMLNTFKVSLSQLNDMVDAEMNASPIIAPVLDLSQVQSEASKLNSLVETPKLEVEVSANKASSIATDTKATPTSTAFGSDGVSISERPIIFEQNNYSPKALSSVELYRQTKNQLALVKGALDL